ncbi:MAG: hypothetical protein ACM3SQ_06915, partial [Betaproteobacteria bacterium]
KLGSPERAVVLWTSIVVSTVAWYGSFERSAWLLMTVPDGVRVPNPLFGFMGTLDQRPVQRESLWSFSHLLMFSGGPVARDFYALRPVYGFVSATFVPLFGWRGAMLFVNIVAWLLAVAVVYHFCSRVTGDRRTASIAAIFAAAGTGFVAHVHDYSPHLLAYATYFAAVDLVYSTGVWRESRSWTTHLMLAAFFAVAALEYHTGLIALTAYALCSLRHNGFARVGVACLGAYACVAAWPHVMNALSHVQTDYGETERAYRVAAMHGWLTLSHRPLQLAALYLRTVANYLSYENPVLVAVGSIGLISLVLEQGSSEFATFVVAFFVMPILALAAYVGYGLASGYLSYITAIGCYAGVAVLLSRLVAKGLRKLAWTATGLLVASQVAWNLAYLVGAVLPIQSYFLGIERTWPWVIHFWRVPRIASLTGTDPVPTLFRGTASMLDAGMIRWSGQMTAPHLPFRAACANVFVIRAPVLSLIAICVVLAAQTKTVRLRWTRSRGLVAAAVAMAFLFGPAVNLTALSATFPAVVVSPALPYAGSALHYEVDVSDDVVNEIERLPARIHSFELVQGFRGAKIANPDISVILGGQGLRVELGAAAVHTIGRREIVDALTKSHTLTLDVTSSPRPILIEGWQKNGLPHRRLMTAGRVLSPIQEPLLPLFELRARDPKAGNLMVRAWF